MRFPLVLNLLSCAALPLSAQGVKTYELPYDSAVVTGAATDAEIGRFDADVVPDAAFLQDGDLVFLGSPSRVHTFAKVVGPFGSLTRVAVASPAGHDGLLVTSATGVELVAWDVSANVLTTATVLEDASWALATELQTIERPGFETWICALAEGGKKILWASWTNEGLEQLGSLSVDASLLALAGLYWDGDEKLDFACDDGSGLRVLSDTGSEFGSLAVASTSPHLLRLPAQGQDDGLLWQTDYPGSPPSQIIATLVRGAGDDPTVVQLLVLAPYRLEAMTLARFDAGDDADVVLTLGGTNDSYARVYYRTGPATFAEVGSTGEPNGVKLELGNVWNTGCAAPAVASGDLDGDGDEDLIYAGDPQCTGEAQVFFANGVDQERAHWQNPVDHLKPWVYEAEIDEQTHLIAIKPWPKPTVAPANDATHIRVRVFRELPSGLAEQINEVLVSLPAPQTLHLLVPDATFPEVLYFEFSYVRRDSGEDVRAFPAWIGIYQWIPVVYTGPDQTGGFIRPPQPPQSPNP